MVKFRALGLTTFALVASLFLTACDQEIMAKAPESSVVLNAKLLGEDKDGNGVRDDIDALISAWHIDNNLKKAYTQYAQGIQKTLTINTTIEAIQWVEQEDNRNLRCFSQLEKEYLAQDPNFQLHGLFVNLKEILMETYNTGPRIVQQEKFAKMRQGAQEVSFSDKTEGSCNG